MTAAAALPGAGAVLRVMRGAAGRSWVRVALLVGGLFAVGVLCGARASAADEGAPVPSPRQAAFTAAGTERVVRPVTETIAPLGTDQLVLPEAERIARPVTEDVVQPVTDPVSRQVTEHAVQPVADRFAQPVAEHVVRPVVEDLVQPLVEDVARPVTEDVAQPVAEHVVRPVVEDVGQPVTENLVLRPVTGNVVVPLGDLVESVTEGLAGVPSQLPPVSGMPSLPGVPGLAESPEPPGRTTLPEGTPSVDVTPREPGRALAESRASAVDGDGGSDGERASGPASVGYGPKTAVGDAVLVSAPHRDAGVGDAPVVRVPAQRNPGGLPTGVLGRHFAVDNGGPRHVESPAVAFCDRAPLSVVPGAPVADAPDGTRDRHRDVPEFPG